MNIFGHQSRAKIWPTWNCRNGRDGRAPFPPPECVDAEGSQDGGHDEGERADQGDDGGGENAAVDGGALGRIGCGVVGGGGRRLAEVATPVVG